MKVKDIMTSNVTTVTPDSTVKDAAAVMKDLNVGAVPVVDQGKPVGIVTDRDIALRSIASGGDGNTPVNQVMSTDLVSGSPDMTDMEAAQLMAEKQVRRLPIVEKNNLVGILALGDLAVNDRSDMEAGKALSDISIPSKPQ
ncbi:MAG: CBS domain-containing protein [Halanaerobiaceae bacterium]